MKIVSHVKNEVIKFRDRSAGIVFKYKNEYWIACREVNSHYNAFNFGTHDFSYIGADELIEPVKAELHIYGTN